MQLNAEIIDSEIIDSEIIVSEVPGIRKKLNISDQTAFFTYFINFSHTFPRKTQIIFYRINVSKVNIK